MERVLFAKDMYKRNADSTVIYTIHINQYILAIVDFLWLFLLH